MGTAIGNTNSTIVISDNANPVAAEYAWYIESSAPRALYKLPFGPGMQGHYATGISLGIKEYAADITWDIVKFHISNKTDYLNLLKALSYWEKNRSLLYLSVKNEWDENLAQWGSYSAPTTLSQLTGQLTNLIFSYIGPNLIEGSIQFVRVTKTTGD